MRTSSTRLANALAEVPVDWATVSRGLGVDKALDASSGQNGRQPFQNRADADVARMAGRLSAANTSEVELARYLQEHAALVQKKYNGNFIPADERRLRYLRWILDRIEDAQYGAGLDALEDAVVAYETFYKELESFSVELRAAKAR